jgi:Ca2+-binding RTX toxin-like protein
VIRLTRSRLFALAACALLVWVSFGALAAANTVEPSSASDTISAFSPEPPGPINCGGISGNNLVIGTAGPDVLNGGNGKDCVVGLDGVDILSGGNGNDILDGGPGIDTCIGGNGLDTFFNCEIVLQ